MRSIKPYPKYRALEIDWIGDIPENWNLEKFRFIFSESSEKIESEIVGEMLSVSGYRGIEIKQYDDENRKRNEEDLIGYRVVRKGQLVVNTMWLNYTGLGISEFEGYVSPAYRCYWLKSGIHKQYIHHLMRSSIYVIGYTKYLTGIRPNSLQMSRDDLMVFPILVPTFSEQEIIAKFLDRETGKLDLLIREQKELIALLQEKRQALISNAVTKGLNPKAKMKDSGVEWLGEVPEHWKIKRLKQVAEVRGGIAKGRDLTGINTIMVPYLRVANVQDGYLDLEDVAEIEIGEDEKSRYELRPGDVLMNEGGDFDKLGRGCVWDGQVSPCVHQNHVFSVRTISITADWLAVYASSSPAKFYFMSVAKQSTNLASISSSNLKELTLPCPSDFEQSEIIKFIRKKANNLDILIEEAEESINLMQEHRASLISEAVTGKIDVRHLA
ncbi:MAG: hypothetical protein JWO30_1256 [Fibrobacteres bacterium]|nr:hypothetical protein [Fibrobacterota bacterium]